MSGAFAVEDEGQEDFQPDDPAVARRAAIEAEARKQGWRPASEYRGPAGGWRDAEEFLRRGTEILPIVQRKLRDAEERNTNLEREVQQLRASADETKAILVELREAARTANDRGYRQALAELKIKQREAVAQGDTATFDRIDEEISTIEEERAATSPKPAVTAPAAVQPQPEPKVAMAPEVEQFLDENPWYMRDKVLNAAMQEEHQRIISESPGLSLGESLQRAKDAVMDQFPKKFGIQPAAEPPAAAETRPRPRVSPVSTPTGTQAARPQRGSGFDQIADPVERAEAKKAFARYQRNMPDMTEAEYLKLYFNPHEDVLTELNARKARNNGGARAAS